MAVWRELLAEQAGMAMARQLALSDLLGEHQWQLDIDAASIDFGQGRRAGAQVLGSEAEDPGTWLWSWANEASNLPDTVLGAALELRRRGAELGVEEFTTPELPLSSVNGHELAMVGTGLLGAPAYYRCPYEGGAAFVLLTGIPLAPVPQVDTPRLVTVISQTIAGLEVDHRTMLDALLRAQRATVRQEGDRLHVHTSDDQDMVVTFDGGGRIVDLTAALSPPAPA
jgi:hypothetical protein